MKSVKEPKPGDKLTWTHNIKGIKRGEAPGVARVTVVYTNGVHTIEKELKLVAEHFQSIADIEREFNRHLEILSNFELTVDQLEELMKQQLDNG